MVHISFNLTFDAPTEEAVRAYGHRLVEAGIPDRTLVKYRPHVTLVAYKVENICLYEAPIATVASTLAPFPLLLESLGIFPDQGVIFLAPRMSSTLFFLHRTTLQAFAQMNEQERPSLLHDWLLPDRWIPHVTLAKRLPAQHILPGVEACIHQWMPIYGHTAGISMRVHPDLVDYRYYSFHNA